MSCLQLCPVPCLCSACPSSTPSLTMGALIYPPMFPPPTPSATTDLPARYCCPSCWATYWQSDWYWPIWLLKNWLLVLAPKISISVANMLFDIWIKYKPQLPDWYYNEKLLKIGDLLIQIKEYKLALLQCYGRYLQQFSSINIDEVIADVNQFKSIFFPSGFRDKNAALTFHALQERNICIYQMVCGSDRNLQNQESLQTCFSLLSSLRLIMQVALPQESLCWLIYNGTIYIYTICRHLMSIGQSVKVLEYLLWASVCMESSVPLLSVHYLTWRTTLYTAVCQCYYDCRASIHGEVFARRGLSKIDELKQLESASSSPQTSETKNVFREATIKMAVMVFKRSVYESRRKPKGYFRPKLRVNLKEAQHLPWPRTVTERLLTEMFDGTSAQFLAIIEALSDSNRRLLHTAPSLPEEPEIRDVISDHYNMSAYKISK
uniref:Cilia and flagella associated protein 54 n=1 Tax=Crocodylus porosus TaxID=8502 RepID=A0A7M4FQU9_CROPO